MITIDKVNALIEPGPNGYGCTVGNEYRFFSFEDYPAGKCETVGSTWVREQIKFQNPELSLEQCIVSFQRLQLLALKLTGHFSERDCGFMIDDHQSALCARFGSLIVFESDQGYNIELVTNWLTKNRILFCTGVSLNTAFEIIKNSMDSSAYSYIEPRRLHLSDFNRQRINQFCQVK